MHCKVYFVILPQQCIIMMDIYIYINMANEMKQYSKRYDDNIINFVVILTCKNIFSTVTYRTL